jgi:hypothetical protein
LETLEVCLVGKLLPSLGSQPAFFNSVDDGGILPDPSDCAVEHRVLYNFAAQLEILLAEILRDF